MNEAELIEVALDHISSKFPKECKCCGKCYESFVDFARHTTYVGDPISYDAEEGDWKPLNPIGTIGMANCSCGSTLAISTDGMDLATLWKVMHWVRGESKRRGISGGELLIELRTKIDSRVLQAGRERPEGRAECPLGNTDPTEAL